MSKEISIISQGEMEALQSSRNDTGFGALLTSAGALPLAAVDVHARIDGLIAEVVLTQSFVNAHSEPLEATYIFPLPDRAAVTDFHMTIGDRVIEAVLKERGEARREYDEAITTGHRAAVAEEERPGVFTLRVGNLMPGDVATVVLTMAGALPYRDGDVTFRFPLVVAPRYTTGTPLPDDQTGAGVAEDTDAVPDASRVTPPRLESGDDLIAQRLEPGVRGFFALFVGGGIHGRAHHKEKTGNSQSFVSSSIRRLAAVRRLCSPQLRRPCALRPARR